MGAATSKRSRLTGKIARRLAGLGGLRDRSARLEGPPPPNEETLQHVAICGVSYCGSTLFARILGSLPGVANIGESHWLMNRRENGVTVPADPERVDWKAQVPCASCGRKCEVLSRDFRIELLADPLHWYHQIALRLGTDILVSADKNHNKIVAHDPLLRLDALVLFKSPRGAVYSHFRHRRRKGHPEASEKQVTRYLEKWARSYELLLDDLDVRGTKVLLDWAEFCAAPAPQLEALCAAMGLPFDVAVLQRIDTGQHCLGGNVSVNQHFRKESSYEIRPQLRRSLPADHEAALEHHTRSAEVYERLSRGHHERLSRGAQRVAT